MARCPSNTKQQVDPYAPNERARQAGQSGRTAANGSLVDRFMGDAKKESAASAANAKQAQEYDRMLEQQMDEQARQAKAARDANTRLYNQIQEQQSRTRTPQPYTNGYEQKGTSVQESERSSSGSGRILVYVKDEHAQQTQMTQNPEANQQGMNDESMEAERRQPKAMMAAGARSDQPPQYGVAPEMIPTGVGSAPTPPVQGVMREREKRKDLLASDPSLPQYILPESTVFECSLVNKLVGAAVGPVACLISTPVYAPGTRTVIFPEGARLVGEAKAVNTFGQSRLALAFHRALVRKPHAVGNYSVSLDDDTPGLDQQGAVGLKDQVNNHYVSIFGASLAVGAIGGLANIGNTGGVYGNYDSSTQFRAGIGTGMAQASNRILDRFLNHMPDITIRPGTRVKVELLGDLKTPAYEDVL